MTSYDWLAVHCPRKQCSRSEGWTGLKRVLVGVGLCVVLGGCAATVPLLEATESDDAPSASPLKAFKRSYIGYSYNSSPNHATSGRKIDHGELVFQISVRHDIPLKIPRLKKLTSKYREPETDPKSKDVQRFVLAYTNLSYWQIFSESAPFRTTNHEPEVFYELDLFDSDKLRGGYIHQSNGVDGSASRSWNRVFVEYLLTSDGWKDATDNGSNRWSVSVKPWYIFRQRRGNNDDIDDFMGYGELTGEYSWGLFGRPEVGLILRNNLDFGGDNRGAVQVHASWEPFVGIRPFVQYFSGFGDSLLDYNHSANRFTVGFQMTL